jgi:hypothetical protein
LNWKNCEFTVKTTEHTVASYESSDFTWKFLTVKNWKHLIVGQVLWSNYSYLINEEFRSSTQVPQFRWMARIHLWGSANFSKNAQICSKCMEYLFMVSHGGPFKIYIWTTPTENWPFSFFIQIYESMDWHELFFSNKSKKVLSSLAFGAAVTLRYWK